MGGGGLVIGRVMQLRGEVLLLYRMAQEGFSGISELRSEH